MLEAILSSLIFCNFFAPSSLADIDDCRKFVETIAMMLSITMDTNTSIRVNPFLLFFNKIASCFINVI